MKIELNINEDCKLCKQGLKYFKKLQKKHPNHYASMNMVNYMPLNPILLTPDYNCEGHLTHFHIGELDEKGMDLLLQGFKARIAESEKIMAFKELHDTKNK